MKGHGNTKGMSLLKLAKLKGSETYHGKACKCGSTLRYTETRCCAVRNGNSPEARNKLSEKKDLFAMAMRAFRV